VKPGQRILVQDGTVDLEVTGIGADHVMAKVLNDGKLGERNNVNVLGVKINLPMADECEIIDIQTWAVPNNADYVELSFEQNASVEQKEKSNGNEEQAKYAKEYNAKVEAELQKICDTILGLLVFYLKMKADNYRYIAEFSDGDAKSKAAESARAAYQAMDEVAEKDLVETHPIRLGMALNVPVQGDLEPRGGVQDGAHRLRGRHRGAGQRGGGLVQRLDELSCS